jgi:type II secretion system protein N
MNRKTLKFAFLFIVTGLLAAILFLYLRFPSDIFRDYFIDRVSEIYPAATITLGDVKPDFSPGITLTNIEIRPSNRTSSNIQAETVTISPDLWKLLKGLTTLHLNAQGYDGRLDGDLNFNNFLSTRGPMKAEIKFENMTLQKIGFIKDLLGRQMTGKLRGTLTFQSKGQTWTDGVGRLEFALLNGAYPLLENISGIDRLDFTTVEGQIDFAEKILKIGKLNLNGDKVRCMLKGDITVNLEDFNNSQLNLTGGLEIRALNNKKVPLSITGTFAKPVTKAG